MHARNPYSYGRCCGHALLSRDAKSRDTIKAFRDSWQRPPAIAPSRCTRQTRRHAHPSTTDVILRIQGPAPCASPNKCPLARSPLFFFRIHHPSLFACAASLAVSSPPAGPPQLPRLADRRLPFHSLTRLASPGRASKNRTRPDPPWPALTTTTTTSAPHW